MHNNSDHDYGYNLSQNSPLKRKNIIDLHILYLKLQTYFNQVLGFYNTLAQAHLSIMNGCEDPKTISVFDFQHIGYPLTQSNQMSLEYILLTNPELRGIYTQTTSYRNEANPIPGRHDLVFPMFEYEGFGDIDDLIKVHKGMLRFLGFTRIEICYYEEMCKKYNVSEICAETELKMQKDFGDAIILVHFPQRTSPFWNMKHYKDDLYNKIDVIIHGMECVGSAERECNPEIMRKNFYSIVNGEYAELLVKTFGRERVERELNSYLSLSFKPRFGAGIGMTRLLRAMRLAGLIDES